MSRHPGYRGKPGIFRFPFSFPFPFPSPSPSPSRPIVLRSHLDSVAPDRCSIRIPQASAAVHVIEALLPSRLATPGPSLQGLDRRRRPAPHTPHTRSKPTAAVITPTPTTRQPSRLHRRRDRCALDCGRTDGAIDFASRIRLVGRRLILPGRPASDPFNDPRPTDRPHSSHPSSTKRGLKKQRAQSVAGPCCRTTPTPGLGVPRSIRASLPRRQQQQQRRPAFPIARSTWRLPFPS